MEAFFLKQAEDELVKLLYEESGKISHIMAQLEAITWVKRETLSRVIGVCLGLYLVFGYAAGLLCNIIGFAYPCYASMVAIETKETDDDTQWLTYWTVFALFSLADFFSEIIMGWMPFYWLAKCILLLWLYLPFTRGAQRIYVSHVRPALLAYQSGPPAEAVAPSTRRAPVPSTRRGQVPSTRGAPVPSTRHAPVPSTRGAPVPSTRHAPVPSTRGAPVPSTRGAPVPSTRGAPVPSTRGAPVPSTRGAPVPSTRGAPVPSSRGAPGEGGKVVPASKKGLPPRPPPPSSRRKRPPP